MVISLALEAFKFLNREFYLVRSYKSKARCVMRFRTFSFGNSRHGFVGLHYFN
jgi:hypothetical protein